MTTDPTTSMLDVRVYYEDTDASGRVYHAAYVRFFERGRTEWLRVRGFNIGALASERGIVFAVRNLEIEYLAGAFIDDLLRVETRPTLVRGAVVEFAQRIVRGEETIAEATIRVVTLKDGRVVRVPAELRAQKTATP
jgi:acyl-CoA thioester hydrolase